MARMGFALAVGVLISAGCSKSNSEKPSIENTTQTAPVAAPVSASSAQSAPASAVQPAANNNQPDITQLNRALIRWIVGNRRAPTDFNDFASTAGVTIPPAPPGKKYIIGKDMHIQLVNQ